MYRYERHREQIMELHKAFSKVELLLKNSFRALATVPVDAERVLYLQRSIGLDIELLREQINRASGGCMELEHAYDRLTGPPANESPDS